MYTEIFRLNEDEAHLMHLYRTLSPDSKAAILLQAMFQSETQKAPDNVIHLHLIKQTG